MSRIQPPKRPNPFTRVLLRVARRETAKLTGRETERMIEPFEAYAHHARLAMSYGMFEGATAKLGRVTKLELDLAWAYVALRAAHSARCISRPTTCSPGWRSSHYRTSCLP